MEINISTANVQLQGNGQHPVHHMTRYCRLIMPLSSRNSINKPPRKTELRDNTELQDNTKRTSKYMGTTQGYQGNIS